MKIGIIGAGRVGCSIGKYLRTKDIELAGYYDVDSVAAKEAAEFTRTESFDSLKQLADQSQIIFITTPDSFIIPVWEQLKELSLRNQIICHCSGALSSDSFSGRESMSVSCCSIHQSVHFQIFIKGDRRMSAAPLENISGVKTQTLWDIMIPMPRPQKKPPRLHRLPVSIRCSNWCVNQTSSSSRHPIRSLYPYGKKSKACHTGIRLYVIVVAHFHPIHFPEPKKQEYPAARFIPCYRSVTNFHHMSN